MIDFGFIHRYPETNFHELNLDWILSEVEKIAKENGVMIKDLQDLKDKTSSLEEFYNDLISGDFPDQFKKSLSEWFSFNAIDIVGETVRFVFFGLNDSGNMIAYIPDNWKDIEFGTTGYDDIVPDVEYGHLTLKY